MSASPFLTANITYKDGARGKLYYLKPAIFGALRLSVLGFKSAYPDFPDDPTTDQFFSEARFEAYRELGFASTEKMLEDIDIMIHLKNM